VLPAGRYLRGGSDVGIVSVWGPGIMTGPQHVHPGTNVTVDPTFHEDHLRALEEEFRNPQSSEKKEQPE
jgi:hypothetical protein